MRLMHFGDSPQHDNGQAAATNLVRNPARDGSYVSVRKVVLVRTKVKGAPGTIGESRPRRGYAAIARLEPLLFSFLNGPLNFTACFTAFDGLASVVQFLAFGEPQLNLRVSALGEVDAQRHQGQPFLLGLPQQLVNLALMKQQLPDACGIMVHNVAMTVWTDMALVEKDFASSH